MPEPLHLSPCIPDNALAHVGKLVPALALPPAWLLLEEHSDLGVWERLHTPDISSVACAGKYFCVGWCSEERTQAAGWGCTHPLLRSCYTWALFSPRFALFYIVCVGTMG